MCSSLPEKPCRRRDLTPRRTPWPATRMWELPLSADVKVPLRVDPRLPCGTGGDSAWTRTGPGRSVRRVQLRSPAPLNYSREELT